MYILLVLLVIIFGAVYLFMQQEMFGSLSKGERLKRIQRSPNYRDDSFQNIHHTPQLTEGTSYMKVLREFIFNRTKDKKPHHAIPSVKTDLNQLDSNENVLIWFGHSSYFLQADGKKFLIDPVLSGSASPLPGGTRAFAGADIYRPEDIPPVDFLIITHDHWDHLDHRTIIKIKPRVGMIVCPLGVGAHFERWGFSEDQLIEKDWHDTATLADGFMITLEPARHFSGRTLKRNTSLWTSYVLQTPSFKIFLGGDSGYDTHFADIGSKHGPFDLAILENGQYDKSWRYIHMLPEEILKAAKDLEAKRILPVHSSKFLLSNHPWDEPLKLVSANGLQQHIKIVTPMIGQKLELSNEGQLFESWWEK